MQNKFEQDTFLKLSRQRGNVEADGDGDVDDAEFNLQ